MRVSLSEDGRDVTITEQRGDETLINFPAVGFMLGFGHYTLVVNTISRVTEDVSFGNWVVTLIDRKLGSLQTVNGRSLFSRLASDVETAIALVTHGEVNSHLLKVA